MATEIERKFLVTGDGWKAMARDSHLLRQGYLSSNAKATVRVRSWDDQRAALTLKGKTSGMSRPEYEYDIPVEDARELLEMAQPHVLEKRRHLVPIGELTWEVDVFEERLAGLVIAEVELSSEDQAVAMPDWIGAEVTHDERFYNASLARNEGIPQIE